MTSQTSALRTWLWPSAWAGLLFAICLLLYLRPYQGIRHDSILYLGQALVRLMPEQLGGDLFFAYGSQAQFTLFPLLLEQLLRHFPAAELFMALTLAGRICFLIASFILIRLLLPERVRYWCLLAVVVMPSGYGGRYIFTYSEVFLTARTLAEPLILLAVAAAVGRRWTAGAAAWLLAVALHPPTAVPAGLFMWLMAVGGDRRWFHVAWPVVIIAGLVFANEDLRSLFLARYDAQWLAWASDASPQAFLRSWRLSDWCHLLTDVFLVSLALRGTEEPLKMAARGILFSTLIAFAASFALTDLLHLVLPTGLQAWRVQWLLHWFAMACLPWILASLHDVGAVERPRLLMLLAIAAIGAPLGLISDPSGVLILIPLYILWPRLQGRVGPLFARLLVFTLAAAVLISFAKFALTIGSWASQTGASMLGLRPLSMLVTHPLMALALVALPLLAWNHARQSMRAVMVFVLAGGVAHASLNWDRRSNQDRFIEASQGQPMAFGIELPLAAEVVWTDHLLATWLVLGRPNYLSEWQMSGLLFSRGTAQESDARIQAITPLGYAHYLCRRSGSSVPNSASCPVDDTVIRQTCAATGGKVAYIIMPYKLGFGILGSWSVPARLAKDSTLTYYLYTCKDFVAPR